MSKFDPNVFFSRGDHVALQVRASEVFGLLRRSLDLPSRWAALLTRSAGDQAVVEPGGRVDSADVDDVLFVRVSPVEVVIERSDLATEDGYQCRADVRVRVSVIPERGELRSFLGSILGSRRVAKVEAVTRHLESALRAALATSVAEHKAGALVDGSSSAAVCEALAEALKAPCFSAGLALEGQPTVKFESATLRKVRQTEQDSKHQQAQHRAARQVREALEHARDAHLDHLSSLLARLSELAQESPGVELPELVRTFSEGQRGEVYEALFATELPAARTQWIVVAAGDELLYFDTERLDAPSRRLTIAGPAGPLRSIQAIASDQGSRALLLGAATGVYRIPLDAAEPDLTLLVDTVSAVRGGFNAAVQIDSRVFASHSELGLLEWDIGDPTAATRRFESMTRVAKAVRGVTIADEDLYCAVDDRIIRWPADDRSADVAHLYTGSGSTITALCPTPDGLFAGNSNGDILHWQAGSDGAPKCVHRGSARAVETLWLLSAQGVSRLVFTDTSLRVHALVVGDTFTCHYEAGGQTLRRVEVGPDLLVATNDLRDRLFCWHANHPKRTCATIGVSRICQRSVQDVCLVAQT